MNIDYYGFLEHPFRMTPNARLFYASSVHARAHAHLMYGLAQQEGFVVVTGEVGAGKTTLIDHLCAGLDPGRFAVARIATTQVLADDLLRLVADAFGAPSEGDKAFVLRGINHCLRAAERHHLLIIDEAQALPHGALEELRMLSNVTAGHHALLQTILVGQPQLRQILAGPSFDQLRQRVLASYHLVALSRQETRAYIEHRMRAVGWRGSPSWEDEAYEEVYQYSDGIPRRINRLCSRVLLEGALERASLLTATMVQATALELEGDLGGAPQTSSDALSSRSPPLKRGAERQVELEATLAEVMARIERLEQSLLLRKYRLDSSRSIFDETEHQR